MKTRWICLLGLVGCLGVQSVQATIRLTEFTNKSEMVFCDQFKDGTPFREMIDCEAGAVIDREGAVIESVDGSFRIVLEDAYRSGYHRPHWKFHVWLESKRGFSHIPGKRMLYAVFFYDGEGEMRLMLDRLGKLHVKGGTDVLYPWKQGKIGRGTPYHEIKHDKRGDYNGVVYFDNEGFVGYPYSPYVDADTLPCRTCGTIKGSGDPRYLGPPERHSN